MHGLNYVYRRKAIYIWRRRLPNNIKSQSFLQVSLRTSSLSTAKKRSALVNEAFFHSILRMESKRITTAEAQKFLSAIVLQDIERIEHERYDEPQATTPSEWRARHSQEKCLEAALRFVSKRGQAADLCKDDITSLAQQGFCPSEIASIKHHIAEWVAETRSVAFLEQSRQLVQAILGKENVNSQDLKAIAALRLRSKSEVLSEFDREKNDPIFPTIDIKAIVSGAMKIAQSSNPKEIDVSLDTGSGSSSQAIINNASTPKVQKSKFSDALDDIVSDFLRNLEARKSDDARSKDKDLRQKRSIFRHFLEIVEVSSLRELSQEDLYDYTNILQMLPKAHGKSPRTHKMTVPELIEEGARMPADKVGLAPATINRNISAINKLLEFAAKRGQAPEKHLNTKILFQKSNTDNRAKRLDLSDSDVERIASHPIWRQATPYTSASNSAPPDAVYWAPILGDLTGARREEILALSLEDIQTAHHIPHIHIRKNKNRRIKNAASERYIPIHSKLIELGFLDYVHYLHRQKENDLFPSMRPNTISNSYGDTFYKKFRPIMEDRLGKNAEGKSFHSFRHRVVTTLRHEEGVTKEEVKDLVGHRHHDETDGRYRKIEGHLEKHLTRMKSVVERLPAEHWTPEKN